MTCFVKNMKRCFSLQTTKNNGEANAKEDQTQANLNPVGMWSEHNEFPLSLPTL